MRKNVTQYQMKYEDQKWTVGLHVLLEAQDIIITTRRPTIKQISPKKVDYTMNFVHRISQYMILITLARVGDESHV